MSEIQTKKCSSCNQTLPLTEFYKDKSKKTGYKSSCKSCILKKKREAPKKQPVKSRKKVKTIIPIGSKIECKCCNRKLSPSSFYKRNNRIIQTCISCRKKNRKESYIPKKDTIENDEKNLESCLESLVQITTGLKKCKSCQLWKEFPHFKKRERSLSGRAATCKTCSNIKNKGDELGEQYIKARRSLDRRNEKIIKLTLKQKGIIK